jgi:hypothetical protein
MRLLFGSSGSKNGVPEGNWCEFDSAELTQD